MPYILFTLLALMFALISANIYVVPQASKYVVERLGKYAKTSDAGLNVKVPLLDKIVKKITVKEQVLDTPPQPVITKDNVTLQVDSVLYFSIFDAKLYTYGAVDPMVALSNLSATTLRNVIGEMTLDESLTSRDTINAKLTTILDDATDKWGIKVSRVEIKNIIPPEEIRRAMEKQMKAERDKRQALLEAEAHKESVILRAEGEKQAAILEAQGKRDAQIALAQGEAQAILLHKQAEAEGLQRLKEVKADEIVLRLKGLETLSEVADGNATKIFMPTDMSAFISLFGAAKEATDSSNLKLKDKKAKRAYVDPCEQNHKSAVSQAIIDKMSED